MYRVFANGPGDRSSIPGPVMPKTQKMYFIFRRFLCDILTL